MKIHKEGINTIIIIALVLVIFNTGIFVFFCDSNFICYMSVLISLFLLFIILQFFRKPNRLVHLSEDSVISPADGKVVVVEKVKETEYFNEERIQVSIFMSLWNVHINWFPVTGIVKFFRYHKGKYLIARNPKSSTENERTTVVIENEQNKEILFRQIAGKVARRIVYYIKENDKVKQSDECGFIKFGSRVDILLPLDAQVNVKIGDKVKGSQTVIAYI